MISNKKKCSDTFWFSLPQALFRRFSLQFGVTGLAVYGLLAAYADQGFLSRLSYQKISHKLGCSNLEALIALHRLEALHLIKSEPGKSKVKSYQLLWIPPWGKVWGKSCGKGRDKHS